MGSKILSCLTNSLCHEIQETTETWNYNPKQIKCTTLYHLVLSCVFREMVYVY